MATRFVRRTSIFAAAAIALGALGLAGCASDEPTSAAYVERPVEQIYNDAWIRILNREWKEAAKQFDEVERQHPYSEWARRAILMSAYSHYQANEYDQAIDTADRFIQLHPGNKDVPYAYYLKAALLYEQITDVGRDQAKTQAALAALQDLVQRYPETNYARDARLKIDLTRDHLAGKEMMIGRYYLRSGDELAAINRFRKVVEQYQTTTHTPEALERLTEAYMSIGVVKEAQTAAAVLGFNYPGSPWYEDAYALLTGAHLKPEEDKGSWISRAFHRVFCDEEMLASLAVKDIVLIEKASLAFAPGLNVLTGETGAGKSILLDALGLAAGSRGQGRAALRPGAELGSATAAFDIAAHASARALLADAGIEGESDIILRRTVSADGRTRAFINDAPVGIALAREIGAALVEVHGLADDRGLFDISTHRVLLDRFGGHQSLADEVAALYAAFASARDRVGEIRRARDEAAGEIEYLTHAARELAELGAEAGEELVLATERSLLMNAGRIAEELSAATDLIASDTGVETQLAQTLRRLSRLTDEGRRVAQPAAAALEFAFAHVQDARAELQSLLTKLESDPDKLEEVEERLFAIRAAARKYNVQPDALVALKAEFEAKLAGLDEGGGGLARAEQELAAARTAFVAAARKLSAARTKAASRLEGAVAAEFAPLKLGQAKFRVALTPSGDDEATGTGAERIGFEIATVAGAAFGPLARIASGGELARFALALKVALAEASPPAVLVFDEVDRGVGGAVANAVGERLQRLARTTQVLLVTHSPQVAARAAKHFRILRNRDATRIDELDGDGRIEEIARMLAGAAVTGEARAAARRLIAEAQMRPERKRARA